MERDVIERLDSAINDWEYVHQNADAEVPNRPEDAYRNPVLLQLEASREVISLLREIRDELRGADRWSAASRDTARPRSDP